MKGIADEARARNKPWMVSLADALDSALEDLSASKDWMLSSLEEGDKNRALAGATHFCVCLG